MHWCLPGFGIKQRRLSRLCRTTEQRRRVPRLRGDTHHEFTPELFTQHLAADRQRGRRQADEAPADIECPRAKEPGRIAKASKAASKRPQCRRSDRGTVHSRR